MLLDALGSALMSCIFVLPAFVLPVLLVPILLRVFRADELVRTASYFTLKPLLATFLWAFLYFLGEGGLGLPRPLTLGLTLVPGIGLTLLILWGARKHFRTESATLLLFLAADALRWLNSFLFMLGSGPNGWGDPGPNYLAGMILPNLYAVMAVVVMWLRARKRDQAAREALGRLEA
jgi:hypothetical protein